MIVNRMLTDEVRRWRGRGESVRVFVWWRKPGKGGRSGVPEDRGLLRIPIPMPADNF